MKDLRIKVSNMKSSNGNDIPNQFFIQEYESSGRIVRIIFQSYNSVIAIKQAGKPTRLDERYWDYSKTTGKYRNQFLGETKKETQAKIDSGEYILCDLN